MIRPSALGDVCRTVPVLASLHAHFPGAIIDWVVQDTFAEAVEAHPALANVIPFPRKRFSNWWKSPGIANEMRQWFASLAKPSYDKVFDLQGLGRSGLMSRATKSRNRVGYRSARELAWIGYNTRHDRPTSTHIVDQMLELLEREGINTPSPDMQLYVDDQTEEQFFADTALQNLRQQPYALLAPTSRWKSKQWPAERWAQLIDPLRERGYDNILLTGAAHESPQVQPLLDATRDNPAVINLIGQTTITETMAVIKHAALVIANDSAPLHMAVGFHRPLVALFGPTDPAFVGPYRCDDRVIRKYDADKDGHVNFRKLKDDDRLMQRITVADVLVKLE